MEELVALKSVDLKVGRMTLCHGNILLLEINDEALIEQKDIEESFLANRLLTEDKPYYSIIISGLRSDLTREAREYDFYTDHNFQPRCLAEAIVIKDLSTRIVTEFYYKLRRFPYPSKTFSSLPRAIEWIQQQKSI